MCSGTFFDVYVVYMCVPIHSPVADSLCSVVLCASLDVWSSKVQVQVLVRRSADSATGPTGQRLFIAWPSFFHAPWTDTNQGWSKLTSAWFA